MDFKVIYDKIASFGPCWYIQTHKMFGDTLHGSIVVAHYCKTKPGGISVVWGISERYIHEYDEFIVCNKLSLPHNMSMEERVNLIKAAEKLPNVKKAIRVLVGEWGWNTAGSISDNMFFNAGIHKLSVPRTPMLPVGIQDYSWSDQIMWKYCLDKTKYGVLEYNSYSLSGPPHNAIRSVDWYNEMLSKVVFPIVYTGGLNDPQLKFGIDLRGCTFRQAKVMIMRSKLMVGCGSGLTMVACSDSVSVPVLELGIGPSISMAGCGYSNNSMVIGNKDPKLVADTINKIIDSGLKSQPSNIRKR